MSLIVAGLASCIAIFLAYKYLRQKIAIRLLAESLSSRTTILNHSQDFRGTNENWRLLIEELNKLIEEIGELNKRSTGQLNQLQATLGSLQEGVVMIDRDNYILLVNKALQDLLPGMASKVGQRLESGLSSSDFLEFVRKLKAGGGPAKAEICFDVGQSELWLEVSGARLTDALEGQGPWYLFVLHDVTRPKLLARARKLFVANASHELKTPVSVIKGYAETLVTDHHIMKTEERDHFLKTIHRHSERLVLLINDLLSLSRLENESLSFNWIEADVLKWLREISSDYRINADSAKIAIELALEERVVRVRFDIMKLRQVFDNLVENALKYSPEGGRVLLGCEVKEGGLTLWVEDSGPGVPEEDLGRIFERFYRVDKGRSRETGGTGLGLSIVKHIIELHGGRVWAENVPTGGLKVAFRLPVVSSSSLIATSQKSAI